MHFILITHNLFAQENEKFEQARRTAREDEIKLKMREFERRQREKDERRKKEERERVLREEEVRFLLLLLPQLSTSLSSFPIYI